MADLTINADDVRNALNEFAASYEPGNVERVEVGRVVAASDGIARVEGLPSVMANELLRFEDGTLGLAQNLDTRDIGVIISLFWATLPVSKKDSQFTVPVRCFRSRWAMLTSVV